jgi:uncharacterized protein (DUF427 family)
VSGARGGWRWHGRERPPFATPPRDGEESVWDYPRPPRLVADAREVVVRAGDAELARTTRALRVLETASPPTFYLPRADVRAEHLERASGTSWCEWKGAATYWDVVLDGRRLERVAWSYEDPTPAFAALRGHVSFYPARVACFVGGVRVASQPGGFYGGWVTPEVVGPFKGEPGTEGW